MLTEHPFNREESEELYHEAKHLLEEKGCYRNVFMSLPYVPNEYQIAYGYLELIPGEIIMARHCFFINEKGEAIDPTVFANNVEVLDRNYFSFLTFDDREKYTNVILDNNRLPDLLDYTRNLEFEIWDKEFPKRKWLLLG